MPTITVTAWHPYPQFNWQYKMVSGGGWLPVDDGTSPYTLYVSGQTTNAIVINDPQTGDESSLRCIIGNPAASAADMNPSDDTLAATVKASDPVHVTVNALSWNPNLTPNDATITLDETVPAEWWVRPNNATYGSGDGLTYETAFSGWDAINWDDVSPGDTIQIRGQHFRYVTDNLNSQGEWELLENNITLDGNNGAHSDDAGEVWGAYEDARPGGILPDIVNWTDNLDGTYTQETAELNRAFGTVGVFEIQTNGDILRYTQVATPGDVLSGGDGTVNLEEFGNNQTRVTVYPYDAVNFANNIRFGGGSVLADRVLFDSRSVGTTIQNLKVMSNQLYVKFEQDSGVGITDATLRNCVIDGGGEGVKFLLTGGSQGDGANPEPHSNWLIENCTFSNAMNGIYFFWRSFVNGWTIQNNVFQNIGSSYYSFTPLDGHCIGFQRIDGVTIDNNEFRNVNNGIDCHTGNYEMRNLFVTNNYFENMVQDGTVALGSAIVLEGQHYADVAMQGLHVIANNIISNCTGVGLHISRKSEVQVYGNTFWNCNSSQNASNATITANNQEEPLVLRIFNNALITPASNLGQQIRIWQSAANGPADLLLDNNYYEGADAFYLLDRGSGGIVTFANWPALIQSESGAANQEGNSAASWTGLRGTYTVVDDFKPADGAAVIGVGNPSYMMAEDYFGFTRPNPPAIGAAEWPDDGFTRAPSVYIDIPATSDQPAPDAPFSIPDSPGEARPWGDPVPTIEWQAEQTNGVGDWSNNISGIFEGRATTAAAPGRLDFLAGGKDTDTRKVKCVFTNSVTSAETTHCQLTVESALGPHQFLIDIEQAEPLTPDDRWHGFWHEYGTGSCTPRTWPHTQGTGELTAMRLHTDHGGNISWGCNTQDWEPTEFGNPPQRYNDWENVILHFEDSVGDTIQTVPLSWGDNDERARHFGTDNTVAVWLNARVNQQVTMTVSEAVA